MSDRYERILLLRKEKDLNQDEAAEIVGISLSSYRRYENGTREPGAAVLRKLADLYGVSIDYLVGRSDDRETQ